MIGLSERTISRIVVLTLVMGMLVGATVIGQAAEKKQIGIMEIDESAVQGDGKEYVTATRVIDLLTAELANTKSFVICERGKIKQILDEQALGLTGAVKVDSSAQIGGLLGLNYMLYGKVVQAELVVANDFLSSWSAAKVVIEARLVDVSTGIVVLAETAEGKHVANTLFGSKNLPKKQDLTNLYESATSKAVQKLAAKLNELNPLHGVVVQLDANKVYIDIGKQQGVRIGDQFKVFREGEPITNPSTKSIIGVSITDIGILKITDVMEKGSLGEIHNSKNVPVQAGDKVKRTM